MKYKGFLAISLLLASTFAYAEPVIHIGAPLPLTGKLSLEATKQQRGYDLWADMVNNQGGINVDGINHVVEIIYKDYQSDGTQVFSIVETLIQKDNVDFLFAPYGSKAARDASVIAQRYRIPMIAITASSSQAYSRGHDYIFGLFTPNKTLIEPLMDVVLNKYPDVNDVALLARNDLFPLSIAREVIHSSKNRNLNVNFYKTYTINSTDYSKPLQQLKKSAPHWIFVLGYTEDLILLRQQIAELDIQSPVLTMIAAPAYQEFIDATGPLSENITSSSWWHPAVEYTGDDVFGTTENFITSFEKRYNSKPDYVEATAALGGALFQLAIERSGSINGERIREELSKMDETTFWGPIRFGENGQNNAPAPLVFQIQGSEAVVIYPKNIAKGQLKLIEKFE